MRRQDLKITALGLACVGLLLAAAPAIAQNQMGSTSSFGNSSSSSGSLFGNSSSLGSNSSSSSFIGGTPSSSSSSSFMGTTTTGTQIGTTGRSGATTTPGATSFLGANYANPLAMGLGTGTVAKFGSVMYNITATKPGTATVNTANLGSQSSGSGFNIRRLPAYAATLKINNMPPPPTALQVATDLQTMLVQSPQLDSRDAVHVFIDGRSVVLQGQVVGGDASAADDERRLVENMVRLTPGVFQVRNEVTTRVIPQ